MAILNKLFTVADPDNTFLLKKMRVFAFRSDTAVSKFCSKDFSGGNHFEGGDHFGGGTTSSGRNKVWKIC